MGTKAYVWEENVIIPTYPVSESEKAPLFIENRAYQGSTGKVYPLPVTEKILDQKEDVSYRAVFLENDYLRVMILPELGGRIQRALDKTNGYDFVYYNHVIKPALVGLTGPWISGGIEFNWPQHHRPSTYMPVDSRIEENPDGSATVYVGEIDRMYGTKGMASFTLYPDKAYIEIKGQLFNNTASPQTFLWWANPAVPVNNNTYSVFPPDVTGVMDHGKRAVSTFPIATGEYYKVDYSAGVDISMYKNVPVPTSYMAEHSDYDFIGNYDTGVNAGLLHVADHHISPGKKQWTWGNADFGRAWDRNLTDSDGPYIELMTGVFADNQPDFTWLMPYEEKSFTQYFMPYKGIGRVKNATKEASVSFDVTAGNSGSFANVGLYTTSVYRDVTITVSDSDGTVLYERTLDSSPEQYFTDSFAADRKDAAGCTITVRTPDGKVLVSYTAKTRTLTPPPQPAAPMAAPADLKSTEELYLAAQHLEQYRHATYDPCSYYLEGLKRDPGDIRLNIGYGLQLLRQGRFAQAAEHFERAIARQTSYHPNPKSGEGYFNLGLAKMYQGLDDAAFDAFYKSTWSHDTQGAGFSWLAALACKKGSYAEALAFADQALLRGWHNMKARTLKAALLRKTGKANADFLAESLAIDPLYMGCRYEEALACGMLDEWKGMMGMSAHNYLVLAGDYMAAGLYEDAITILEASPEKTPLVYYYIGYCCGGMEQKEASAGTAQDTSKKSAFTGQSVLSGKSESAALYLEKGEAACADRCFPNRVEDVIVLEYVIDRLEKAPNAHHLLGDLFYDKKRYEDAAMQWEASLAENDACAMTHRNLSIYHYNKTGCKDQALYHMERALTLEPEYPRFLQEYTQLQARCDVPNEERLKVLEAHREILEERDVLYLEYITLMNLTGHCDDALRMLKEHTFHPWEGGEGKVIAQYRYALMQKALCLMDKDDPASYEDAISLLKETIVYPDNLGEGKLPNVRDNTAQYYIGCCLRSLGRTDEAAAWFRLAAAGSDEPSLVLYYNDQPSDPILYQGLALRELGEHALAMRAFRRLISFGQRHLFDQVSHDYFAVSLPELDVFPEPMDRRNIVYCRYLMALGEIGLEHYDAADALLDEILAMQPHAQGAIEHKIYIQRQKEQKA